MQPNSAFWSGLVLIGVRASLAALQGGQAGAGVSVGCASVVMPGRRTVGHGVLNFAFVGRYREFERERSSHRRSARYIAQALRLLNLMQLTFAPPAVARANDRLVAGSVCSPAIGHRPLTLHC